MMTPMLREDTIAIIVDYTTPWALRDAASAHEARLDALLHFHADRAKSMQHAADSDLAPPLPARHISIRPHFPLASAPLKIFRAQYTDGFSAAGRRSVYARIAHALERGPIFTRYCASPNRPCNQMPVKVRQSIIDTSSSRRFTTRLAGQS